MLICTYAYSLKDFLMNILIKWSILECHVESVYARVGFTHTHTHTRMYDILYTDALAGELHESIIVFLPGFGLKGQQANRVIPDVPLPTNVFLIRRNI